MPSDCIFCSGCKQYRPSADFILNRQRAPYKTCKSCRVNPFILFILTIFLTLYIGEKKGTVPTATSSGPFAAYKPNYSRYCFRYYFCRRPSSYTARINPAAAAYIDSAATAYVDSAAAAYVNPAATAYIDLAATYYRPPYRRAARSWPYYYRPPYYGAARSRSHGRRLQLLRRPTLD